MIGGKVTPRTIAQREKERRALELRKAGRSYEDIADEVGVSNRTAARRLVVRAFERITSEPAEELRALELERLNDLYAVAWHEATSTHPLVAGQYLFENLVDAGPQLKAIEVCLRVMDRRAKLTGLDAPARSRVEIITEDVVDAEIKRLEAQLASNSPSTAGEAAAVS